MKYLKISYLTLIFVFTLALIVSAETNETYIFEYPEHNITIEFSDTSLLSNNARQIIADSIVSGSPIPQAYSLCWLLGHDTVLDKVTAVYHKKSVYDPRCQLEIYDVTSCTNCDYVYPDLVSSTYISCCPPEASAVSLD